MKQKKFTMLASCLEAMLILAIGWIRFTDIQFGNQHYLILGLLYVSVFASFIYWGFLWGNVDNRVVKINLSCQVLIFILFTFGTTLLSRLAYMIASAVLVILIVTLDYWFLYRHRDTLVEKRVERSIAVMGALARISIPLFLINIIIRTSIYSDLIVVALLIWYLVSVYRKWWMLKSIQRLNKTPLTLIAISVIGFSACLIYYYSVGIVPGVINILFLEVLFDTRERSLAL